MVVGVPAILMHYAQGNYNHLLLTLPYRTFCVPLKLMRYEKTIFDRNYCMFIINIM